jgi:hypothetical protein
MRRNLRIAAAGLALLSAVGLAACGDDDADSASSATDRAGGPSSVTADSAYCDDALAWYAVFNEAPQDDPAVMQEYAGTTLSGAADKLAASLPAEASDAGSALATAVRDVAETGSPEVLFSPDTAAALATIGGTVYNGCDLNTLDVRAVEYAYEGLPDDLDAGPAVFKLENEGVEEHEIVMFRRNDGVTASLDEILEMPEDQLMQNVTFAGVAFGAPGTTAYTATDLSPGTYFFLCFIPVGGADGPPHFMEGMQQTVTVS